MPDPIADLAREVLQTFGLWRLPVNPYAIVKKEGIGLEEGDYGDRFDARIEFYPSFNSFCIYHERVGGWRTDGRVRFSIAHELGHFYLPEHCQRLRSGRMHNSVSDYRSKDPFEEQADEFAAALLMPLELFRHELDTFSLRRCDLKDLSWLADRLGTSITSTARRYCQSDREPCTIFFSENGVIRWGLSSTDMQMSGMYFYKYGSPAPADSKTAELWERIRDDESCDLLSGSVDANVWFKWPKADCLWEQVMPLGNTGIAITQLTPED